MTEKKQKRPSKGRVFQCTGFPNCNKSFTRLEHLARHRRKHTGERPFTCPHCHKNFSRLDNLRQHKQTVDALENYVKKRDKEPLPPYVNADFRHDTPQGQIQSQQPQHPQSSHHQQPSSVLPLPQTLTPHGNRPMVSPPSSGLPNYGTTSAYYPLPYVGNGAPSSSGPGAPGPLRAASTLLRDPPKFNPKTRPKPLALVHSFTDDTYLHPSRRTDIPGTFTQAGSLDPPLRTAPPAATFAALGSLAPAGASWSLGSGSGPGSGSGLGPSSFQMSAGSASITSATLPAPSTSRFAYLTPMMVSPLSPLFHQSFNQVLKGVSGSNASNGSVSASTNANANSNANGANDASAKSPNGNSNGSAKTGPAVNGVGGLAPDNAAAAAASVGVLPPVRLPAIDAGREKAWLRDMLNDEKLEKPSRVAINSLIEKN